MIGLLPNCAGAKPSLRRRAVRRVMLSDLSIMGSGFVDAFNSLPLMTIVMLRSSYVLKVVRAVWSGGANSIEQVKLF